MVYAGQHRSDQHDCCRRGPDDARNRPCRPHADARSRWQRTWQSRAIAVVYEHRGDQHDWCRRGPQEPRILRGRPNECRLRDHHDFRRGGHDCQRGHDSSKVVRSSAGRNRRARRRLANATPKKNFSDRGRGGTARAPVWAALGGTGSRTGPHHRSNRTAEGTLKADGTNLKVATKTVILSRSRS